MNQPQSPPWPESQQGERLHALDAVRAFALLTGIALHGTMSFFIGVPARDNSPSTTLEVLFFVIHIFRMSLFYLIAGFFACLVLERKGWKIFLQERLQRIGLPLVGFWFVLVPLSAAPVLWGLQRSPPDAAINSLVDQASTGIPLMHLWFLYYLLMFYALALLWYGFINVSRLTNSSGYQACIRGLQQVPGWALAPLLLAVPVALMLLRHENWNPWLGIPTHEVGLVPWLTPAVVYAIAFFTGWLVHGRNAVLACWQQRWQWYVAFAAILSALCIGMIGTEPSLTEFDYFNGNAQALVIYAASYATALWCWCFGLTGLALRYCSAPNPTVRYLADASYWLYLMHIPVVFTLQVLLMDVPLHWLVKYPVLLIITIALLLLTYKRWVRSTWLGQLLNGRRQ